MGKGLSVRGNRRRAVLAEALEPRRLLSSTALPVSVSVAYYDTEHASPPAPTPWMGSPNTTFFGNVDSTGVWDGGAILITNPGPGNATIAPGLRVDGFANSASFQLWDGNIGSGLVLAPGKSVVFAQPNTGVFDTSDQPIINDPTQRTNNQPVVHLTINSQQYNLTDTNQIINTGGFDPGEAYHVSESLPWTQIGGPGTAVLTSHNDNARTGLNSSELQLTPGNVNQATFGKKFSYAVDGQVYAQPLYVPNLAIPGKGTHNVVIIATEHDSVYAFDADNSSTATGGGLLWQVSMGNAAATPPPNNAWGSRFGPYSNIAPWVGITGTPVIDPATNIMYLDAFTNDSAGVWTHHIHALNLTTGADAIPPVLVAATSPGNGVGGNGTTETFTATQQLQRPALSLVNGRVFVAYGSYADTDPYHGWVLGYNAANLQLQSAFNSTPNLLTPQGANPGEGAFWQAGAGLASDGTNLYGITGNGDFNAAIGDYGDSFVKLTPASNSDPVTGYFTPHNQQQLSDQDEDLGSGGVLVLPDSVGSAAHPHLLVGCGKQGVIYLIDQTNMGGYGTTDNVVQEVNLGSGTWSSPAYFNGRIYFHGVGDVIKAFSISGGVMSTTPVATSTVSYGYPGATPSISSNGTLDGIVWEVQSGGTLHAYNAATLAEIFNSNQVSSRDQLGSVANFILPTIADGHVIVGTSNSVVIYGLFPPPANPPAAPTLLTGVAQNFQTVNLKWQDNSNNEDGFYIWRSPHNANAWVQIGTTIVNATTYSDTTAQASTAYDYEVQAHNTFAGSSVSAFTNIVPVTTPAPPPVGTGDGLSGAYYVDQVTTQPHFNAPAILTRTDASIDFDWGNGSPNASITNDYFSVIWTGQFKPTTTQVYTFSTTSDDGVRLFVNGVQIINDFSVHPPTVDPATMSLTAGTTYSFEMDYFEATGGAVAKLHWNTSTIADTPVPFLNGGATGKYFNDPASGSGYSHLQGTPVLTRVDHQIDSTTWPNYTPDPSVGNTNFSVKWTGRVQPQYTETYTFLTISDDGVMLFVNGQQLLTDWTDHGSTTDSGTISLVAGQLYNIEMDFYQGSGPDFAQLQWSSPSTPQQLIPQSQLYSALTTAAPSGLAANAASGTQVNLSWNDNSSNESGFDLERKTGVGGTFAPVTGSPLAANTTTYIDTGLTPGTTYYYEIRALNSTANSPYTSPIPVTMPTPPATPSAAHETSATTTQISIAWTDNSNNEDGFRILRSSAGGGYSQVALLAVNTTTFIDTGLGGAGLSPGTEYDYEVEAYNSAVTTHTYSTTNTATLTLAPTTLAATGGPNQIVLNWTAPSYTPQNATALTFNVYRGTTAGGESPTPLATGLASPTFTDTSVTVGQAYYYKVTAVEIGGESAAGNEATAAAHTAGPLPALLSEVVGDGTGQRSVFGSVTLTFSLPVTPSAGAVTLARLTTDAFSNILTTTDVSTGVTLTNPSNDGMTWVLTVVPGGSLDNGFGAFADGNYRLTLHAAKIKDAAGDTLAGGDQVEPAFTKLYGDIDGDGVVGPIDFGRFRTAYGSNLGDTHYSRAFDIDGDGTLGPIDFGRFRTNYGKQLFTPVGYAYVTDAASYSGVAGSTITASVYLMETGGSSVLAADQGLVGAGAGVSRLSGSSALSAVTLDTADFDGGPSLSAMSISSGGAAASFSEAMGLTDASGPTGTAVAGGRRQLLGTLTITLSTTPGTTLFTLGRNPSGNGSSATFTGTFNLDADGNTAQAPYQTPAADGNNYSWAGVRTNLWSFVVKAI